MYTMQQTIPEKKPGERGGGGGGVGVENIVFENSGNFQIFYFTPDNSKEKYFTPTSSAKFCYRRTSEILRLKTKTPGNCTKFLFFLDQTWKFHVVLNQPLEIPLTISSVPLEITYPHILISQIPPCLFSLEQPNNGNTVLGENPMSYCLTQLKGYGNVRKTNKNQIGRSPCKS